MGPDIKGPPVSPPEQMYLGLAWRRRGSGSGVRGRDPRGVGSVTYGRGQVRGPGRGGR